MRHRWTALATAALLTLPLGAATTLTATAEPAPPAADAGPLTDTTNLEFTDSRGVTSSYHLYAAGLDWTKPVGLMIYTDGTGEYGLNNPDSPYLLAGDDGLVNVAKRHNLILLTPHAPGGDCRCWYQTSTGIDPDEKAAWSADLIEHVQSRYGTDPARVAFGGYSSGAQWTTRYFGPRHAAQVMTDGVAVAISYGGQPSGTPEFTPEFIENVPFVWNVGANDPALNGSAGARDGYDWYTDAGFATTLDVVPGVGHGRSGQFGAIMDDAVSEHVPAGSTTPPTQPGEPTPTTPTPTVSPTTRPTPPEQPRDRRPACEREQSRHEHPSERTRHDRRGHWRHHHAQEQVGRR